MAKKGFYIITLILISSLRLCAKQDSVQVRNVALNFAGNLATVSYDIAGNTRNYQFFIELKAYNSKGLEIPVVSLNGDVNKLVKGGDNKFIQWDIKTDYPQFNDSLIIEILATPHVIFELSDFALWSVVYPGYVTYKETGKKPYALIGVTSYGLLASSFVLENVALQNYNKYEQSNIATERDSFYEKAQSYRKTSNQLLYASLGIWVSNAAMSFIIHNKQLENISIGIVPEYAYNQINQNFFIPCISLNIKWNSAKIERFNTL